MKTVTIIIGNSDDKLTQARWSHYVNQTALRIGELAKEIHFAGGSRSTAQWQNAAWVIECNEWQATKLKSELSDVAKSFEQTAMAWVEGDTKFI